jgi:hypothetical protein
MRIEIGSQKNPQSAIRNNWADAFPRNALTSGPQACFFTEKRRTKVKVAKGNDHKL